MTELSPQTIAELDPQGMVGDILDQGNQVADALWRVESAGLRDLGAPGGLVVCGMGGSAIGGDLAAAAIGARAVRPIVTARDYAPPPWVGPNELVLCASYSGTTEETVSAYRVAGERGSRRVALTTGGDLAAMAREDGVPVIGVPAGLQPRAAVAYMTVAALECATAAGAAPSLRTEIEAGGELLKALAEEWGPESPADSSAKSLAGFLAGSVPVIYGAGPTAAVAYRWKTQVNENAKWPAYALSLPEADHNDICGWAAAHDVGRLSAVFLEDADQDPRSRRRIGPTAEAAAAGAQDVERVESRGASPVERVMSLVLLGDLVTAYLAVLQGTDPTPVAAIDDFKAKLA